MRPFPALSILLLAAASCAPPTTAPSGSLAAALDEDDDEYADLVEHEGRRLFERETFGGNGRTCLTCHPSDTGTLAPADVQRIAQRRPGDPLFLHDGSDDGLGHGTSRIQADATILVNIPLPAGVHLADDPNATRVTLRHGIPSTLNTPALDPVLMYDGRGHDLVKQARGAIDDHTQHAIQPSAQQLQLIADFQKTEEFFSSPTLRRFAEGGPAPTLPAGKSASEQRGRRFFVDGPIDLNDGTGLCALCHSGPMLNESNGRNPIPIPPFFVPRGERFQSVLTGELLPNGDPFRAYLAPDPDSGQIFTAVSSDPGLALQSGDFRGFPVGDLGKFKIPSLRNIRNTAPYFHNNSAKTLDDVINHYRQFFVIAIPVVLPGAPVFVFSQQDQADIIAFLKLL